ncbi:uncharacterized protein LOC130956671 [Arachis stenosperma]|uniref:uncharacterized protein LOC130956671 n=1 Tax=Arachis stenosperma TaxID=217475 RepID=UPI0025AD1B57|nr:uncharacterized protein LOC130956671 [Arachis stenosperma]
MKELELMQLKQDSLSVADYTSRFEELCRFSRVCQGAPKTYESWKCIKYQRGLKDNIMIVVAPLEIRIFSELVNKARVIKKCTKTVASSRDTRGGNTNCGRGKWLLQLWIVWSHCERLHSWEEYSECGPEPTRSVFAVNANGAANADPLMRGICLIGDKTLVALFDTGALHLFIAFNKVEELGLKVS